MIENNEKLKQGEIEKIKIEHEKEIAYLKSLIEEEQKKSKDLTE